MPLIGFLKECPGLAAYDAVESTATMNSEIGNDRDYWRRWTYNVLASPPSNAAPTVVPAVNSPVILSYGE